MVGTQRDQWLGFTMMNPNTANLDEQGLIAEIAHNVQDAEGLVTGYRKIREGSAKFFGKGEATDTLSGDL